MGMIPELDARQLQQELASEHPPILVDVREADELQISRLDGAIHIPMRELPARLGELSKDANLVIVCRTGSRSGRVTGYLLQSGFSRVRNLAGGMNGWARDVDQRVAQY